MTRNTPHDIQPDHPAYWTLINPQMNAVARQDHRYRQQVKGQLRDLHDDPEAFISGWEAAKDRMDDGAYAY